MGILDSAKKIVKKINPFSKKDGKEVIKRLLETKIDINKEIKKKNIDDGTILFFEYEAKDQTMIFDQKPLIIVFGISNGYVLGLNFHWIPMKARKTLIEYIIKINIKNNSIKVPLEFKYKDFKKMLKIPDFRLATRIYIRNRMSKNGVIIDPKYLLDIAQLSIEHFSDKIDIDRIVKDLK